MKDNQIISHNKQWLHQQNMKSQSRMNAKPGLVGQLHRRHK